MCAFVKHNLKDDDALIQSGITALSQRREEACTNFINRDCLSSPVLKPLIPCVSIDRPYCHSAFNHIYMIIYLTVFVL